MLFFCVCVECMGSTCMYPSLPINLRHISSCYSYERLASSLLPNNVSQIFPIPALV